jgi:hypothetical protein
VKASASLVAEGRREEVLHHLRSHRSSVGSAQSVWTDTLDLAIRSLSDA